MDPPRTKPATFPAPFARSKIHTVRGHHLVGLANKVELIGCDCRCREQSKSYG
jgi:hypothetical protein